MRCSIPFPECRKISWLRALEDWWRGKNCASSKIDRRAKIVASAAATPSMEDVGKVSFPLVTSKIILTRKEESREHRTE